MIAATKRLFPRSPAILKKVFGQERSKEASPSGTTTDQGTALENNSMERLRRASLEMAPNILSLHQTAWLLNLPPRAARKLVRAGLLKPMNPQTYTSPCFDRLNIQALGRDQAWREAATLAVSRKE